MMSFAYEKTDMLWAASLNNILVQSIHDCTMYIVSL